MAPSAKGSSKPCRTSRRLAAVDAWLNDDKRDRITDVVRQHIGVGLMVSLLMQGGWAGVVGSVPTCSERVARLGG